MYCELLSKRSVELKWVHYFLLSYFLQGTLQEQVTLSKGRGAFEI